MKRNCTADFLQFREIARLIWNVGFWPTEECRAWECAESYELALARLFEGMFLRPLGYFKPVADYRSPGLDGDFEVEPVGEKCKVMVNKNFPGEPGRLFEEHLLGFRAGSFQLRFGSFFDWYQLSPKEFQLVEVRIERMDDHPEFQGKIALLPVSECSFWVDEPTPDESCPDGS